LRALASLCFLNALAGLRVLLAQGIQLRINFPEPLALAQCACA
jgi:hypothetical protein